MKLNIPFYKQDTEYTCGPVSLQMAFCFGGISRKNTHKMIKSFYEP